MTLREFGRHFHGDLQELGCSSCDRERPKTFNHGSRTRYTADLSVTAYAVVSALLAAGLTIPPASGSTTRCVWTLPRSEPSSGLVPTL